MKKWNEPKITDLGVEMTFNYDGDDKKQDENFCSVCKKNWNSDVHRRECLGIAILPDDIPVSQS